MQHIGSPKSQLYTFYPLPIKLQPCMQEAADQGSVYKTPEVDMSISAFMLEAAGKLLIRIALFTGA